MNIIIPPPLLLGRPIEQIVWNTSLIYRLERAYNIVDFSSYHGEEVYMISSGVNFLRPPSVVLQAISDDARDWKYINCYCGPLGESILRGAVLVYEESLKGSPMPPVEAALTVGAAEGIRLAFDFLRLRHGARRVLVAGPQYSIVHQTIVSAGLDFVEVFAATEGRFLPDPKEIEAALEASGASVLFLTEPNNPSGEQHSQTEFDAIIAMLRRRGAFLVLDKISSDFSVHHRLRLLNYGSVFDHHDYWSYGIVVDSLSKRRAISGLRFGYVVGPQELVDFIQNQRYGSCPPLVGVPGLARDLAFSAALQRQAQGVDSISDTLSNRLQSLNREAQDILSVCDRSLLGGYVDEIRSMYDLIFTNRDQAQAALKPWLAAETDMHSGFNYLVGLYVPDRNSAAFALRLFEHVRVACYPLDCFVGDLDLIGPKTVPDSIWLRISCATEQPLFQRTIEQLCTFLERHC